MTDFFAFLARVPWQVYLLWVLWLLIGSVLLFYTASTTFQRQPIAPQVQRLGYAYDADSMFRAVHAHDVKAVDAFLASGMSPNLQDKDGATLLTRAAAGGTPE